RRDEDADRTTAGGPPPGRAAPRGRQKDRQRQCPRRAARRGAPRPVPGRGHVAGRRPVTELRFYGDRPPGIDDQSLPGRLVVIEGTDGVGRSTQVALLKEWLEDRGYAVLDTGLARSELAGPGIKRAREGHTLDPITLNLFYATDYWESGRDYLREPDVYRSFVRYQTDLLAEFLLIAERYGFAVVDARKSVGEVFEVLRTEVEAAVSGMEVDRLPSADLV